MLGTTLRDTLQASKEQASGVLSENNFAAALGLEGKRTERSGKMFLLALFQSSSPDRASKRTDLLNLIVPAIRPVVRQTDMVGWYEQNVVLGIVFTHLQGETKVKARDAVDTRVRSLLAHSVPPETLQTLHISYLFWGDDTQLTTTIQRCTQELGIVTEVAARGF